MTLFNKSNNFGILNSNKEIKAAAITAHPDDETIWMGGTILNYKNWSWDIIISTYTESDDRGKEFVDAIKKYRKQYEMEELNYKFIEVMQDEQNYNILIEDKQNIYKKLDEVNLSGFDVIFTHNIDGEYEHGNHRILGEYFKEKAEQESLNIWHFLCPAIQNPRKKQIGHYIETIYLNPVLLTQKYLIFQYSYLLQRYLWAGCNDFMKFQFCSGVEMFTSYKNNRVA